MVGLVFWCIFLLIYHRFFVEQLSYTIYDNEKAIRMSLSSGTPTLVNVFKPHFIPD